MVASFLSLALLSHQTVDSALPKVVGVAIYSENYALVTYQVAVPANGVTLVKNPPAAITGTLWIQPSPTGKVKSVTLQQVTSTETRTTTNESMLEVLKSNLGKSADLTLTRSSEEVTITGAVIIDANPNITTYEVQGKRHFVPTSKVVSFSLEGGVISQSVATETKTPTLRIESENTSYIHIVALQPNLNWTPTYKIDIDNNNKFKLTAKAVVLNDLVDIEVPRARLIAGFPKVAAVGSFDPMTTLRAAREFTGRSIPGLPSDPTDNSIIFEKNGDFSRLTGGEGLLPFVEANENLYTFHLPGLALKKGERAETNLFEMAGNYRTVYIADFGLTSPSTVPSRIGDESKKVPTQQIHFENTSGNPIVPGLIMIVSQGDLLGQTHMPFAAKEAVAQIPVGTAPEIECKREEQVADRELATIKDDKGRPIYDTLVVTGKITITNYKSEPVEFEPSTQVIGEASASGYDAQIQKSSFQFDRNSISVITWNLELKSGQTVVLPYTYRRLVSAGSGFESL